MGSKGSCEPNQKCCWLWGGNDVAESALRPILDRQNQKLYRKEMTLVKITEASLHRGYFHITVLFQQRCGCVRSSHEDLMRCKLYCRNPRGQITWVIRVLGRLLRINNHKLKDTLGEEVSWNLTSETYTAPLLGRIQKEAPAEACTPLLHSDSQAPSE